MTSTQPTLQHQTSCVELVALVENDLAVVAAFIAAQSGRTAEAVSAHLRWFWLENPARNPQQPLGFGLRSAEQLVGCILCSPQVFRSQSHIVLLMGSSCFYVDDRYRGHGGRIFLQYSRLAKQWPLFGTSANIEAAALWKAVGATPIPYSEDELFGVIRWSPVIEEVVHRRNPNPVLSRLAANPIASLARLVRPLKINGGDSGALQPLVTPEEVVQLPIYDGSSKLTAMRDEAYIRWRYFSGRDASVAVFAFQSGRLDGKVLVTVNQRPRGYRGQISTLNVLDVYPEVSPHEWLQIIAALIYRYGKMVDAIVLRSQPPERQKMFCEKGFQRRVFDAPNGWFLDKAALLPTRDWYPVPADGDAII